MIEIFDRGRIKQAVLQNALNVTETLKINALYELSFSLPYDDPKNEFCKPFWLARFNNRLYRIQPSALEISDAGLITYTCEHVLAVLLDKTMFGYYHIGGLGGYTTEVINWVLSGQSDWRLGECDFARQFEYGWEQETILSALLSVPSRFTEPYIWTYNTENYPWTLNLKRLDTQGNPQLYIRNEKNALSLTRQSDPRQICTRLYPLGYGEGVNQLGIKAKNNGAPYLQSPAPYIEKYGIVERIWIDRRYEDPDSLMQAAQAMLDELQEPYEEYSVSFAELQGGYFDEADIGKIVQITDSRIGMRKKSYVTEITRNYDNIMQSTLTIANKPKDIASSIADMADRQRIEAAYSQGATQLYAQSVQANADANSGAEMSFDIPEEMRIINHVKIKVKLSPFRAYSQATMGGGGTTVSSSSGGGSSTTTNSGGGRETTTRSGGGDTSGGFDELSDNVKSTTESVATPKEGKSHRHSYTVHLLPHKHSLPQHTHSISLPDHTHGINLPTHTHNVTLPNHTHAINPGIYFFGNPSSFRLFVNGSLKGTFNTTSAELDITDYLIGDDGKIARGSWQSIEIRPDGLAYVVIDMSLQGFIQSRGDKTV